MQNIFYHNFSGETSFTGNLKAKEVHHAITLHPIKQPSFVFRLHNYFRAVKVQELNFQSLLVHRELLEMNSYLEDKSVVVYDDVLSNSSLLGLVPQLTKFSPQTPGDVVSWDFFSSNIFSPSNLNPKRRIEGFYKEALDGCIGEIIEISNRFSKQRGRIIEYKDTLYGYSRVSPLFGVDYILDLLLTYKKYRGKKMTVPVRRHAYMQQTFSDILITQLDHTESRSRDPELIHFILPLSGRPVAFKRFIRNFEEICLRRGENVKLVIVLFHEKEEYSTWQIHQAVNELSKKYSRDSMHIIESPGTFSRALGLELGAKLFMSDSLLFFIDVDMVFDARVLEKIRFHTIKNRQVYFPIVFSQFDVNYLYPNVSNIPDLLVHGNIGHWRQFGFGILSIYQCDLHSVGGLDTSIKGWGKEDVDLYDKIVRSEALSIFRAPDPGLVHVFHEIACDSTLPQAQYVMCQGSKVSSIGPLHRLLEIVLANKDLFFGPTPHEDLHS